MPAVAGRTVQFDDGFAFLFTCYAYGCVGGEPGLARNCHVGGRMDKTFKRSLAELQSIVAATDEFFAACHIDASIRLHVDLSIEELFVNMVNYNDGTDSDILLQLRLTDGGVEVSLTDYDVDPFDPTCVPDVDVDAPLSARSPNGLGLYLVSKMVDSIHYEYHDRQSRITFFKRAQVQQSEASHA